MYRKVTHNNPKVVQDLLAILLQLFHNTYSTLPLPGAMGGVDGWARGEAPGGGRGHPGGGLQHRLPGGLHRLLPARHGQQVGGDVSEQGNPPLTRLLTHQFHGGTKHGES